LLVLLASGFVLAASTAEAQVDISVGDIRVSQAVQDDSNTVTLVADRSTVVRAEVVVAGRVSSVTGVDGVLRVFRNGSEITPPGGVASINGPFTAPFLPSFSDENDTLNFELPAPTGIGPSADVDFVVELGSVGGEVNTTNNSGSINNLSFVQRCNPRIYYTRINWTPGGLGLPDPAKIAPGVGDAFVQGIFPFKDGDPMLYTQGLFPSAQFSSDADGDGIIDGATDGAALVNFIESCRQLIVAAGHGPDDKTFLYGWIKDNPTAGNGQATIPGYSAWGNTQDIRSQRTFAHELGHLFGYFHNNRFLDEVGWDVTGRLIDNPATNNVTTQVKELDRRDIMVPGLLSEQAWVDTSTYSAMLSDHTVQCAPPDFHNFVAIIQGIFDPWDPYLSELNPVFRYPWPSSPTPKRFQQGPFTLRLVDETGREYVQNFDATTFTEDPEGPETQFGAFQVGVPVDPNARIVLMQIYDGQRLLASMQGSKEPTIEILSPQPGDSLGEMTTIAVQIEDSDTDPSLMMINAAYSPDDGESWVPIAVQLPGTTTEFEVNTTEIQRSDGEGVIRVFVSDGLNTAYADAVDLTPKQAIYAVPEPGFGAGLILCASVLSILGRRPRR
jgi:hypothetical protein